MRKLEDLKILIVGLGQIGGSIGIDLVDKKLAAWVSGFDKNPAVAKKAVERKVVHEVVDSLDEAVKYSNLVILAAPIREIVKMIPEVCAAIDSSAAILDMAGTKTEILRTVRQCGRPVNYFGGHPMAGTENIGLASAQPGLFRGRKFILTPMAGSDRDWQKTIMELLNALEAKPLLMAAEEHDRLIALTSHLPYVLSLALMGTASNWEKSDEKLREMAAGSFHSATRVAASSPDLTLDMFLTNQGNISTVVDEMMDRLQEIKAMVESGDEALLRELISEVHQRVKSKP